jgi:hypothetical protein
MCLFLSSLGKKEGARSVDTSSRRKVCRKVLSARAAGLEHAAVEESPFALPETSQDASSLFIAEETTLDCSLGATRTQPFHP